MPEGGKKLTIDDLKKIKERYETTFALRDGAYRARVIVHMGTCGISAGARDVLNALVDEMAAKGTNDVIVTTTGCAGFCSREPMATVEILGQAPVKYCFLDAAKIKRIFAEHILGGNIVGEYALVMGSENAY